jgi:hypothetical protein
MAQIVPVTSAGDPYVPDCNRNSRREICSVSCRQSVRRMTRGPGVRSRRQGTGSFRWLFAWLSRANVDRKLCLPRSVAHKCRSLCERALSQQSAHNELARTVFKRWRTELQGSERNAGFHIVAMRRGRQPTMKQASYRCLSSITPLRDTPRMAVLGVAAASANGTISVHECGRPDRNHNTAAFRFAAGGW